MTTAPPPLAPSHRTTITHSVLLRRHRRGFHCALAPATVRRLLLRDSPLLTSREKVAAAAVGRNKDYSCLCDRLCPSKL
ncbi:hypothetical protein ACFX2C_016698 [Malus domestica]